MKNSSIVVSVIFVFLLEVACVSLGQSAEVASSVQRKAVAETNSKSVTQKPDSPSPSSSHAADDVKTTPKPTSSANDTCGGNKTNCQEVENGYIAHIIDQVTKNKDMLLRTMYVLIGVTGIVIVYFVIRAWRLRSRRRKARKYGIITTPASDLEMAPLGQGDDDDEDEDMTVFEMNGKRMK